MRVKMKNGREKKNNTETIQNIFYMHGLIKHNTDVENTNRLFDFD